MMLGGHALRLETNRACSAQGEEAPGRWSTHLDAEKLGPATDLTCAGRKVTVQPPVARATVVDRQRRMESLKESDGCHATPTL
jgi:hypothetical protein